METLANILKSLGINNTIWIQLGFFILTFLILKNVLFKPYLALLKERDARTNKTIEEANNLSQKSSELTEEYEKEMLRIRAGAVSAANAIKDKAYDQEKELIATARTSASGVIRETRKNVDKEVQNTKQALKSELNVISDNVVNYMVHINTNK